MLFERNSPARCFVTPPPQSPWKSSRPSRSPTNSTMLPLSERKKSPSPASANKGDLFHIIHKVPAGDSPYVKAKQVQVTTCFFIPFTFFCVAFGISLCVLFLNWVPWVLGLLIFLWRQRKVSISAKKRFFFSLMGFCYEFGGIWGVEVVGNINMWLFIV